VPLLDTFPWRHHTENRLFRPGLAWRRLGRLPWHELAELVDHPSFPLWASGRHTCNDRVLPAEVRPVEGSLRFIRVERAFFSGWQRCNGQPKVKIEFGYAENWYRLSVTDPLILAAFGRGGLERADLGPALVCVSLTQPFNGYCYKLAASVLVRPSDSARKWFQCRSAFRPTCRAQARPTSKAISGRIHSGSDRAS